MPIENDSGNDKSDPKVERPDAGEVNPVSQEEHSSDTNRDSDTRKPLTRYERWQVGLTIIGALLALGGLWVLHQQNKFMNRQTTLMENQNKLMERQTDEDRELAMRSINESSVQAKTAVETSASQSKAALDASSPW